MTGSVWLEELETIDELSGTLASSPDEQRLMRSVLENDADTISEGKLIEEAMNQGLSSFTPSMLFEHLVKDYKNAKRLYGETLLAEATGHSTEYLERNIRIPEFRRELKKRMEQAERQLKEDRLIDREAQFTERALKLASLVLHLEELDRLAPKGVLGDVRRRKRGNEGMRGETMPFRRGKYSDLAVRKTLKVATRRGHNTIMKEDLRSFARETHGEREIVYCLDASGSMKGRKLGQCKKAGVALAYKAIEEGDKVGLAVFGSDVRTKKAPTKDFAGLVKNMAGVRASTQTDIAGTIQEAAEMLAGQKAMKHIILITDALPTTGIEPENETLNAAANAAAKGVTISVVGIQLDEKGKRLAERIAERGRGRVFIVKDFENIDAVVLEDYYGV